MYVRSGIKVRVIRLNVQVISFEYLVIRIKFAARILVLYADHRLYVIMLSLFC